jgi:hypothetical protein
LARTRTKPPTVRRVQTKEERGRSGAFLRLKTDEKFLAHALFEPDPELENNPGYFEYYSHWDQQGNTYVPCSGENCMFCRAGQAPSTRALTVWYFPKEDAAEKVKIFTFNWTLIQEASDIQEEEGALIGKEFRVKRLDDRGEYRMRPTATKPLTKTEIKPLLKEVPDLEEIVSRQLANQLERMKAQNALNQVEDEDDEDEDEEEETPKARRGRPAKSKVAEPEDTDEDEDEDEEDEEDEEEEVDEDEDEDEEPEDEEEEAISGDEVTVISANEDEQTIKVNHAEVGKFDLWLGEDVEIDFDTISKGAKLVIDAEKDEEGDWVATSIKKKRGRPAASTSRKK